MTLTHKKLLLASAAVVVMGLGLAPKPALAFDELNWTWDKTVTEDVVKTVNVNIDSSPTGMLELEKIQMQIGDQRHLGVGGALGDHRVVGKGEVGRRVDGRLRILQVDVLHLRQVADAAADHHVAFILDGARLGAALHAQEGVLGIGPERHEQDVHALFGEQPAQLRKLDVVADQDADAAGVGVVHLQAVAS